MEAAAAQWTQHIAIVVVGLHSVACRTFIHEYSCLEKKEQTGTHSMSIRELLLAERRTTGAAERMIGSGAL